MAGGEFQADKLTLLLFLMQAVVFALGPGSRLAHVDRLFAAMQAICEERRDTQRAAGDQSLTDQSLASTSAAALPKMKLTPRQAFFARTER